MYIEEMPKKTSFRCPIGRNPKDCDGHSCPRRAEDPTDDHYSECVEFLYSMTELSRSSIYRGQYERREKSC